MKQYENPEERQMLQHIDELLRDDQPCTVTEQNGHLEITKTPPTLGTEQVQTLSNKNSFFSRRATNALV